MGSDDAILGPDEPFVPVATPSEGPINRSEVALAINALRHQRPRIHAVVAPVAQPFVANVAAALAIDISMTIDATDIRAMAISSDGVLINLGMLDRERREGIMAVVGTAVPFVLDPVKVDRSGDRLTFARALVDAQPRIIKGNAGEMAVLGEAAVDTVRVTTGPYDEIAADERRVVLGNDTPILSRVIATGCATGLLMTAMSAVEPDPFTAAVAGAALMAVAGEIAAEEARGPGSFAATLLDVLYELNGEEVARRMTVIDA